MSCYALSFLSCSYQVYALTVLSFAVKVDKVPLTTVRPFEFADLVLQDLAEVDPDSGPTEVERELKKQVSQMSLLAALLDKCDEDDNDATNKNDEYDHVGGDDDQNGFSSP
jgi:hypothetical protein